MPATELADATIVGLRQEHDALAGLVRGLDQQALSGPSGAAEWSIAQVLSHLGSGAEITLRRLADARSGEAASVGFSPSVWARWNGMTAPAQRDQFIERDGELVHQLESLSPRMRSDLLLPAGFRPGAVSLTAFAGFRFMEVVMHSWDVRAGLDASASLLPESAELLPRQLTTEMSELVAMAGATDGTRKIIRLAVGKSALTLEIAAATRLLDQPAEPTARFLGGLEAFLRLMNGRLRPQYTPAGVKVTGNTDLDELRSVFPGY